MRSTWGTPLEIGNAELDAQHRQIVATALALEAALARAEAAAVEQSLELLAGYVLVQFETEERSMRRTRFPQARDHVAKHDEFLGRLLAMAKDHEEEGSSAVLRLRLRNALVWMAEHVEDDDHCLGRHLAAADGSPAGATYVAE